jgi:hypothetical protein
MLTMLSVVDVVVSWYCISEVIEDFQGMGGGGMVLFASEVSRVGGLQRTLPQAVLNTVSLCNLPSTLCSPTWLSPSVDSM